MVLALAAIICEVSSALGINLQVLAEPFKGGSNSVYEIQSGDSKNRWCLRIPLEADTASFSGRETAIMRYVKERLPVLPVLAVIYQPEY